MRKANAWLIAGSVMTGLLLAMMLASLAWLPYDPYEMSVGGKLAAPSLEHILGTDNFGRDVFSRLMEGSKYTMLVAVSSVAISLAIGTAAGLLSGHAGGLLDAAVMRLMDAISSFPGILLALVMVAVLKEGGKYNIIAALSILFVPSFARIARGGLLQLKSSDYVKAAKVFGASGVRIIFLHIMPNLYPQLLSSLALGLSSAVMAESGMSYLGLGIQPPTPSWGRMMFEAQAYLFKAPWYPMIAGAFLVFAVMGLNCLGEGVRRTLP
jgi:peptide/nickel transport system permease protein